MGRKSEIRLYVEAPLGAGQVVALGPEQAHYLFSVMRRGVGDPVLLFNGTDGEWAARIVQGSRKGGELACETQTQAQDVPPDLWLAFAPIRRARMEVLVEKASEIGVLRMIPVRTEFTDKAGIKADRLAAIATEAAEQSRGMYVPELAEPVELARLLDAWPKERALVFLDEAAEPGAGVWPEAPAGLLIGPEGGFSQAERQLIGGHPAAVAASLGARTLRAETAGIVALARWHEAQR